MTKPLTIFGEGDPGAVDQINNVLKDERAVAGALMGDNHLGYSMPIGGVVAYDGAVSVTGVGFDIGCGNMAVKTDFNLGDYAPWTINEEFGGVFDAAFDADLKQIMREIQKKVAFGLGRVNDDPVDHALFEDDIWKDISYAFGGSGLFQKAKAQLGTVGSGNHYVDVLVDGHGWVWVANHFGSRGLGHTIASGFMAKAAGRDFTDRVPETEEAVVLDVGGGKLGDFYIEAMQLAGRYAYAGREYVMQQVLDILGVKALSVVHNHHNFAWYEDGLWVVRKGATPLTYESAFIGGSMGDISVIVKAKEGEWGDGPHSAIAAGPMDIGNLMSAPHGAGRVMSRTKAAGKLRKMWVCQNRACNFEVAAESGVTAIPGPCPRCDQRRFRKIRKRDPFTAAIDWDATRAELASRGIVVLGAGADEAPGVYKDLSTVLGAHPNIEILEMLRPIGVVMAGADIHDPFKD